MKQTAKNSYRQAISIIVAITLLGLANTAQAAGTQVIVIDGLYGSSELLDGNYIDSEKMIKKALVMEQNSVNSGVTLAQLQNNLCVVQTLQRKHGADEACNAAVNMSKQTSSSWLNGIHSIKELRATTLSNRSVSKIINKDYAGAEQDLIRALEIRPSLQRAKANLKVLLAHTDSFTVADAGE